MADDLLNRYKELLSRFKSPTTGMVPNEDVPKFQAELNKLKEEGSIPTSYESTTPVDMVSKLPIMPPSYTPSYESTSNTKDVLGGIDVVNNLTNQTLDIPRTEMPSEQQLAIDTQAPRTEMSKEQMQAIDASISAPTAAPAPIKEPSQVKKPSKEPSVTTLGSTKASELPEPKPEAAKEEPAKAPDELVEAQKEEGKKLNELNMLRAINQIASGFIGTPEKEASWMPGREELIKKPVKDLLQQREEARKALKDEQDKLQLQVARSYQDPNSPLAEAYKAALVKMDPRVKDEQWFKTATAQQIKDTFNITKEDLDNKGRIEERKIMASANALKAKEAADAKVESELTKRRDKKVVWLENNISNVKSIRGNMGNWRNSELMADRINSMIDTLDPKDPAGMSSIRTKEIVLALGTMFKGGVATDAATAGVMPQNLATKLADAEAWTTGKDFATYHLPTFIKEVKDISKNLKHTYSNAMKQEYAKIFNDLNAKDLYSMDPEGTEQLFNSRGFTAKKDDKGKIMVVPDASKGLENNPAFASLYVNPYAKTTKPTTSEIPTNMAKVRAPDGKLYMIPKGADLDKALSMGGKLE